MAPTMSANRFLSHLDRLRSLADPLVDVMVTDSPRRFLETEPEKIERRLRSFFGRASPGSGDAWRATLTRLAAPLEADRNRDRLDPIAAFEARARDRGYQVVRASPGGPAPADWASAKERAHEEMAAEILEAQVHLVDTRAGRPWAKALVERLWYLGVERIEPELAQALAEDFAFERKLTVAITARLDAYRPAEAQRRAARLEAHFDGAVGDGPHELARATLEALQLGPRPWELPLTTLAVGEPHDEPWTPQPGRKTAHLRDRLGVPCPVPKVEDAETAGLIQLFSALGIPAVPTGHGEIGHRELLLQETVHRAVTRLLGRGEAGLKGGDEELLYPAKLPPLSFADLPPAWDPDDVGASAYSAIV